MPTCCSCGPHMGPTKDNQGQPTPAPGAELPLPQVMKSSAIESLTDVQCLLLHGPQAWRRGVQPLQHLMFLQDPLCRLHLSHQGPRTSPELTQSESTRLYLDSTISEIICWCEAFLPLPLGMPRLTRLTQGIFLMVANPSKCGACPRMQARRMCCLCAASSAR